MDRRISAHAISRRAAIASGLALAAAGPARAVTAPAGGPALGPPRRFSFALLEQRAAALAARPFRPPPAPPPELTGQVDYDAFGRAAYRPEAALWRDGPAGLQVRFFPLGRAAPRPVQVHVVDGPFARQALYSPELFDLAADSPVRRLGPLAGFGGFRVMDPDGRTDWIAYLGASYFRSADPFGQYGLSARGLAIDTAAAGPEEFPAFTAFWLEQDGAGGLIVYALLEGPSVVGAYRLAHRRSSAGLVQHVTARLHFRRPLARLGLAPLTSMYWYGASDRSPADDWRPQIHDSDGLAIWTGKGERIWRPLANPPRVITNAFLDASPRGFGLLQRDREFRDYQDDGVFYERRPSAWVEPLGAWGEGSVQLVEIPTSGEVEDNVVAFWTPAAPVRAGDRLEAAYLLHWADQEPGGVGVARAVATRTGRGGRPGSPAPPGRRKFVVDFAGGALPGLTRASGVEGVVSLGAGAPIAVAAYPVVGQRSWRLMFDADLPGRGVLDMRAYLRRGGQALTETWIYQAISG